MLRTNLYKVSSAYFSPLKSGGVLIYKKEALRPQKTAPLKGLEGSF